MAEEQNKIRSLPAGILIHGAFLGSEVMPPRDPKEPPECRIGIGIGVRSVTVYMSGTFDSSGVSLLNFGDDIIVLCRVWAGKNGVGFSDGTIV